MSHAERHEPEEIDELRGEARREIEEAGVLPPIPVVAPEVEEGVKRGVVVGALVGAALGVLVGLLLPVVGVEWLDVPLRVLIGGLCGAAAGSVAGLIGGVEVKEEP